MMNRSGFLRQLLGRPYALGAVGPESFDCFGLVAHVSEVLFGRRVPREGSAMLEARRRFAPAVIPVDGAIVVMRRGDRHVGIWLAAEGGILHALEDKGVIFSPPATIPFFGFGQPRFFNPR